MEHRKAEKFELREEYSSHYMEKYMLKIIKPSEIDSVLGTGGGVGLVTIDQDRIDKFADTMDHQFIHVDPEQATPVFGSTIVDFFRIS